MLIGTTKIPLLGDRQSFGTKVNVAFVAGFSWNASERTWIKGRDSTLSFKVLSIDATSYAIQGNQLHPVF